MQAIDPWNIKQIFKDYKHILQNRCEVKNKCLQSLKGTKNNIKW